MTTRNTTAGNLDGGGFSYSAQALRRGGPDLWSGHHAQRPHLHLAQCLAGHADNVVAGGQTFAVSGPGATLGFLGTGDYGTASGGGTITYTDGSTQPFTLSFADWWANSAVPGGDIVASAPYINTPTGKQNQQVSVYYAAVPLQAGKTVRYVTLPDISQGVATGTTAMHIFAAAIG